MNSRLRYAAAVAGLLLFALPGSATAQKTDTVTVRNGDRMVGDVKELQRGQLKFTTDAMSTVYVQWPKIVTIGTNKTFAIELADGSMYFGSLHTSALDSVVITTSTDTVTVATQSVVSMDRLKDSFWNALDGSLNLGLDFTQQNAKVDVNLSGDVHYATRKKPDPHRRGLSEDLDKVTVGFNLTKLSYNATFSRQDDTDDIQRASATLSHLRQLRDKWFWVLAVSGEQNSQLSLDFRATATGGVGNFIVQTNKLDLGLWVGPAYSRERFTGEDPDNSIPLILAADLEYFTWGSLNTDISTHLSVLPILNQWGRWRINFNLTLKREVLTNVYLNLGVTEAFDSDPTADDANKNDFSFTTSLGWTF